MNYWVIASSHVPLARTYISYSAQGDCNTTPCDYSTDLSKLVLMWFSYHNGNYTSATRLRATIFPVVVAPTIEAFTAFFA